MIRSREGNDTVSSAAAAEETRKVRDTQGTPGAGMASPASRLSPHGRERAAVLVPVAARLPVGGFHLWFSRWLCLCCSLTEKLSSKIHLVCVFNDFAFSHPRRQRVLSREGGKYLIYICMVSVRHLLNTACNTQNYAKLVQLPVWDGGPDTTRTSH